MTDHPTTEARDVERLAEAILASVSWEPDISRFALFEDDGPDVLAERIAAEYSRLRSPESD